MPNGQTEIEDTPFNWAVDEFVADSIFVLLHFSADIFVMGKIHLFYLYMNVWLCGVRAAVALYDFGEWPWSPQTSRSTTVGLRSFRSM